MMLTLNQTNLQQQETLALIHQMNQEPRHKEDKRLVSALPRLNVKCELTLQLRTAILASVDFTNLCNHYTDKLVL